jgi:hypothetical protein
MIVFFVLSPAQFLETTTASSHHAVEKITAVYR